MGLVKFLTRISFKSIILIGCILQIHDEIDDLLAYKVIYSMTPQSASNIELPSITLCTSWQRKALDPHFDESISDPNNSYNKTISSCRLLANNGSIVDCDQTLSIEHSIDSRHNCWTFSDISYNGSGFYDDGHLVSGRNMMVLELVKATVTVYDPYYEHICSKVLVSIHQGDGFTLSTDSHGFIRFDEYETMMVLGYNENRFNILPYPYQTDCIDYEKNYGSTRSRLIDTCINRLEYMDSFYYRAYKPMSSRQIQSNQINPRVLMRDINSSPHKERTICYRKYPKRECHQREYRLVTKKVTTKSDSLTYVVQILGPSLDGIVLTSEPNKTLANVLITIAGIICFWYNLSVLDGINWTFETLGNDDSSSTNTDPQREPNKLVLLYVNRSISAFFGVVCVYNCYSVIENRLESPFTVECLYEKLPTFVAKPISFCTKHGIDTSDITVQQLLDKGSNIRLTSSDDWHLTPYKNWTYFKRSNRLVSMNNDEICISMLLKDENGKKRDSNYEQRLLFDRTTTESVHWISFWIKLQHIHKLGKYIKITVHRDQFDISASVNDDNSAFLKTIQYSQVYFTYDISYFKYISGHRHSRCFDYRSIGFVNRNHAIRQCIIGSYLRHQMSLPPFLLYNEYSERLNLKLSNSTLDGSQLISSCRKRYKMIDCIDERFKLHVKQKWKRIHKKSRVIFYGPQSNDIIVRERFISSTVEMFSNIGGIVGIWLGLAMYDSITIIDYVRRKIRKILKKRRSTSDRTTNTVPQKNINQAH